MGAINIILRKLCFCGENDDEDDGYNQLPSSVSSGSCYSERGSLLPSFSARNEMSYHPTLSRVSEAYWSGASQYNTGRSIPGVMYDKVKMYREAGPGGQAT